jgi:hypothetical protein
MSQVFHIYWQAWGYEQAQRQKQRYIKKTSHKLDKIIKGMYINALSKMIFKFPTQELRNEHLKKLLSIPKNIESFMEDLEFLSKMCIQDRLTFYGPREAHSKYSMYTRSRSRIFRPFVKQIPKHLQIDIDSLLRVDAIVCLF